MSIFVTVADGIIASVTGEGIDRPTERGGRGDHDDHGDHEDKDDHDDHEDNDDRDDPDDHDDEPEFHITVRLAGHKPITLSVQSSNVVMHVKGQIKAMVGIAPRDLRLLFAGVDLDNDKKLSEVGVAEGSELEGKMRGRGGGVKKDKIKIKASGKTSLVKTTLHEQPLHAAFTAAQQIAATTEIDGEHFLNSLDNNVLNEIKMIMTSGRSHLNARLEQISELTPVGQQLDSAIQVLQDAKSRLSTIIVNALAEKYPSVADILFRIEVILNARALVSVGSSSSSAVEPPMAP
jgi:hypothetical protein